jgi:hypothetical protein
MSLYFRSFEPVLEICNLYIDGGANTETAATEVAPFKNLRASIARSFDVDSLPDSLAQSTAANTDRYASSDAVDCMRAYYKLRLTWHYTILSSQ